MAKLAFGKLILQIKFKAYYKNEDDSVLALALGGCMALSSCGAAVEEGAEPGALLPLPTMLGSSLHVSFVSKGIFGFMWDSVMRSRPCPLS